MRKTYYHCDIKDCTFKTEDPTKIIPSRILGKEYDLCEACRKSLDDFIQQRLEEGHTPEQGTDGNPAKDENPFQFPWLTNPPYQPPYTSPPNPWTQPKPMPYIGPPTNPDPSIIWITSTDNQVKLDEANLPQTTKTATDPFAKKAEMAEKYGISISGVMGVIATANTVDKNGDVFSTEALENAFADFICQPNPLS